MESTLFTTLSTNEEANLSGGKKVLNIVGSGGPGGNGGPGGSADGGVILIGGNKKAFAPVVGNNINANGGTGGNGGAGRTGGKGGDGNFGLVV
ncbi:MAG: hypothetical protein V7K40_03250 [Nostoc sp.]|uniref:hypothetical protein n=1 Tax=Nostoc sp. TaxID=1180 RepID=UPI002FF7BA86